MALDVKISYSWTDYCRLCLLDNGIMLPIFEGEGQSREIGHKIQTCLQLLTYDGDPLPRKICHTCLFKVNQTYDFRTMALQSFEKLRTHLLPLQVAEVKQYLEKAEELQRPVDANGAVPTLFSMPCSPSLRESDNAHLRGVKIKKEKANDDISDSQQWQKSSSSQLDSATFQSPFVNTSFDNIPQSSYSNLDGPVAVGNIVHDSLKRKRIGLSEDDSTINCSERNLLIGPKPVKKKRSLAGPACRKKIQNADLKCIFCSSNFRNKSSLQFHVDNCLKCPTCKEEFTSVAEKAMHEAQKHINVVINAEKKLLRKNCSQCPAKFASNVMLNMHYDNVHHPKIASHQKSLPSRVEECRKLSGAIVTGASSDPDCEDGYPLSVLKVTGNIHPNICPKGVEEAESPIEDSCLNTDVMENNCTICNEIFPSRRSLNEHEKVVHGQYRCPYCTAQFTTLSALNSHRKAHTKKVSAPKKARLPEQALTSTEQKRLSCHTCYEEFQEEDAFILHLYKHATDELDDEKLPKKKSRKSQDVPLKSSTTSSKVEPEEEQFVVKCEQCRVVCRSKEHYKVHIATHVSKAKTKFPCTGCTQDFRNVEALNRHTCKGKQEDGIQTCCLDCGQALVEGEDHICDNKCPQCDKVFKSARGQRLHYSSKHKVLAAYGVDCHDEELLGSEANHVDSEEEQIETCEDTVNKVESPAATAGRETSSFVEGSPVGNSFPRERLPPDGAPLDDPMPCHFDSLHNSKAHATPISGQPKDDSSLSVQTKDMWPCHRSPAPDGKSNDSVDIQPRSEYVHLSM